jgi:hypothetical protein
MAPQIFTKFRDSTHGVETGHQFDAVNIVKDHYRAGYSRPLLWFDSIILTLLIIDALQFVLQLNGSFLAGVAELVRISLGVTRADLIQVVLLVIVMMVIIPALIAIVRIGGWLGDTFGGPLSASPNHVLILHCCLCLLSASALVIGHDLEIVSGRTGSGQYLFESSVYNVLVKSEVLTWVFVTLGLGLVVETIHALIAYAIHGEEFANPVKQYLIRAELADLPSEWLPIHSADEPTIRPSQNQPRIRLIQDMYTKRLAGLRTLSCSDRELRIRDEIERSTSAIREHLFESRSGPSDASEDVSVRLFVEPRRAFEAALSCVARPRTLILSPFASPSLASLLNWYSFQTGDDLRTLQLSAEDYLSQWEQQESRILQAIQQIIAGSEGSIIFIVSEVFYASGRRILLSQFLMNLRAAFHNRPFHVVVDGTNAVANDGLVPRDAAWDSYIFSTQRWLMAAESCGVLLSSHRYQPVSLPEPPGLIRPESRNSESHLRALAAVATAIDAIGQQTDGIEFFFSRCRRLRKEIRFGIPSTTQVIGDGLSLPETFVMTFCPSDDHRWRLDSASELENEVLRRHVPGTIVKVDPRRPWLRVALPFYLDAREISRTTRFLKEATS